MYFKQCKYANCIAFIIEVLQLKFVESGVKHHNHSSIITVRAAKNLNGAKFQRSLVTSDHSASMGHDLPCMGQNLKSYNNNYWKKII